MRCRIPQAVAASHLTPRCTVLYQICTFFTCIHHQLLSPNSVLLLHCNSPLIQTVMHTNTYCVMQTYTCRFTYKIQSINFDVLFGVVETLPLLRHWFITFILLLFFPNMILSRKWCITSLQGLSCKTCFTSVIPPKFQTSTWIPVIKVWLWERFETFINCAKVQDQFVADIFFTLGFNKIIRKKEQNIWRK